MSSWKNAVRAVAATAVAGASLVGISAVPASAATCTYTRCNGLDPEASGCSKDAVTKLDLQASLILAELRWSPSCHAFWTRLRWDSANGGIGQYAYIAGGVYDDNHKAITKVVYTSNSDGTGPSWTKMIGQDYPWERFCVFTANDDGCKITNL